MMTVKAIRHHQSFAGRDADDAHAQYLRLTNTSEQTMLGSLNLGDNVLTAGSIIAGPGGSLLFCSPFYAVSAVEMCFNGDYFVVSVTDDLCLTSTDGTVAICGVTIELDACTITLSGQVEFCGSSSFYGLLICCGSEEPTMDSLLRLHNSCEFGEEWEYCIPLIDIQGEKTDRYSECASLWDGAVGGENHAKYCLCGGIFINVNGCHRYIKFHKPLL